MTYRVIRPLLVVALIGVVVWLPPGGDRSSTDSASPPVSLGYTPTTTGVPPATTTTTSTTAAPPPPPPTTWLFEPEFKPPRPTVEPPFFALGDSVMLGARPELLARGVDQVNAAVSRQLATGTGILAGVSDYSTLVVHLGTNGPTGSATVDSLLQAAQDAGFTNVFVVTIQLPSRYRYEQSMNDTLRQAAGRWNATILDWETLSDANPLWLAGDGIHLTATGRAGYADMIATALLPPDDAPQVVW
ncbi:MAG: hypothetical protein GY929_24405 [Actinomycetia bacterium]|nr:hypothetical protein [Actinomycetes bacterium]